MGSNAAPWELPTVFIRTIATGRGVIALQKSVNGTVYPGWLYLFPGEPAAKTGPESSHSASLFSTHDVQWSFPSTSLLPRPLHVSSILGIIYHDGRYIVHPEERIVVTKIEWIPGPARGRKSLLVGR